MFRRLLTLGCLLAGFFGQALAQEYPARTIKIIVGFGAGGVADLTARIVAQKMSENMGKGVIIENLPSAGGIIAASTVAKAAADGYTLYIVSNQNAVSPALMKSLPYHPVEDFAMISSIGFFDLAMVADRTSSLNSVADVLKAAERDPSHFNIGTIGIGSTQHLSAELFKSMAHLEVPTVPFKGSGDVITALRSGTVQIGFETLPAIMTQIKGGSLKALAVTSEKPLAALPRVPTLAESGLPGYRAYSWNGLAAPGKTPHDIITRLNLEVTKALASPDTKKRLQDIGIEAKGSTPEALKAMLESEIAKWRAVVERAKIEKR